MEYMFNKDLAAFLQVAAPVSLVAAAGLVLVPRLWDSAGKTSSTILATLAMMIPMIVVGVAACFAWVNLFATALSLVNAALFLEPVFFAIVLSAGYLMTRKVQKIKPGVPCKPDRRPQLQNRKPKLQRKG